MSMTPTATLFLNAIKNGARIRSLGKGYRLVTEEEKRVGVRVPIAVFVQLKPFLTEDKRFSKHGIHLWHYTNTRKPQG